MHHSDEQLDTMSFGSHLEVLRQMLIRIASVVALFSIVVFGFKDLTFSLLLAPKDSGFVTFRAIEWLSDWLSRQTGLDLAFRFDPYQIDLISTELSAQFMMHLTASVSLGALLASPYIIYELLRFVSPALYASERRYTTTLGVSCYVLFVLGVLLSYFVLSPLSFRFLGTYQVDATVHNTITLDSYITTFTSLTFTMGLVAQLPVVSWILAKAGWLRADLMSRYRRHALVVIMIAAAIITPPDVFTLCLMSLPLYGLYELCILIVRRVNHKARINQ